MGLTVGIHCYNVPVKNTDKTLLNRDSKSQVALLVVPHFMSILNMQHIILVVLLLLCPTTPIIAVGPIEASPNTENSPSVYLFPFKLDKPLPTSGYLLVTMPNYVSAITPTTCKLANTSIVLSCCNLRTPTIPSLTIS